MVERRVELDRRYHRKEKMRKLKRKLAEAKGEDRTKILAKIKALSPLAASAENNVLSISGKGNVVWVSSLEGTASYTWQPAAADWPAYTGKALTGRS